MPNGLGALIMAVVLAITATWAFAAEETGLSAIAAGPDTLTVTLAPGLEGDFALLEYGPWEASSPADDRPSVWEGKGSVGPFSLPRFEGQKDRLFSKFLLVRSGHAGGPRARPVRH